MPNSNKSKELRNYYTISIQNYIIFSKKCNNVLKLEISEIIKLLRMSNNEF